MTNVVVSRESARINEPVDMFHCAAAFLREQPPAG
jgi:hypothetical protein